MAGWCVAACVWGMVLLFLPGLDSESSAAPEGIDKPLQVTTIETEPYVMLKYDSTNLSNTPSYYGYIPDLLEELATIANFRYELKLVPDRLYGFRTLEGKWNGMIGQLIDKEADIAAGPILVTDNRKHVVAFLEPFLPVHATVLLRKPPSGFPLGIKSVSDLINQSEIKYGTLDKGIIIRAYKNTNNTILKIMWRKMNRFSPSTLTQTNEDGIHRVRSDKYGFVIQDTIGEYIALRKPCDLVTVDKFLINKTYSLAVTQGSKWQDPLNKAMIKLKDSGRLNQLYRRWWVESSDCNGIRSSKIYSVNTSNGFHPHVVLFIIMATLPSHGLVSWQTRT